MATCTKGRLTEKARGLEMATRQEILESLYDLLGALIDYYNLIIEITEINKDYVEITVTVE